MYHQYFNSMEKIISDKFGSKIIQKKDKLFIRFDEGHFNVKWVNHEISKDEADRAMRSEQDAYKVCLEAQQRNKTKKKKSCRWF